MCAMHGMFATVVYSPKFMEIMIFKTYMLNSFCPTVTKGSN